MISNKTDRVLCMTFILIKILFKFTHDVAIRPSSVFFSLFFCIYVYTWKRVKKRSEFANAMKTHYYSSLEPVTIGFKVRFGVYVIILFQDNLVTFLDVFIIKHNSAFATRFTFTKNN